MHGGEFWKPCPSHRNICSSHLYSLFPPTPLRSAFGTTLVRMCLFMQRPACHHCSRCSGLNGVKISLNAQLCQPFPGIIATPGSPLHLLQWPQVHMLVPVGCQEQPHIVDTHAHTHMRAHTCLPGTTVTPWSPLRWLLQQMRARRPQPNDRWARPCRSRWAYAQHPLLPKQKHNSAQHTRAHTRAHAHPKYVSAQTHTCISQANTHFT